MHIHIGTHHMEKPALGTAVAAQIGTAVDLFLAPLVARPAQMGALFGHLYATVLCDPELNHMPWVKGMVTVRILVMALAAMGGPVTFFFFLHFFQLPCSIIIFCFFFNNYVPHTHATHTPQLRSSGIPRCRSTLRRCLRTMRRGCSSRSRKRDSLPSCVHSLNLAWHRSI
jgi:hypothetical protein